MQIKKLKEFTEVGIWHFWKDTLIKVMSNSVNGGVAVISYIHSTPFEG